MTWAQMAVKGLERLAEAEYGVTWNCTLQPLNQRLIENYALSMAEKKRFQSIAVRAGGK